jgi:hypothetical protein
MSKKTRFSIPLARFLAIFVIATLLLLSLSGCEGDHKSHPYEDSTHTHVYGHWQDAATAEGERAKEVRYCKICHLEEIRDKQ